MIKWLKSLFRIPQPAGPPQPIRMFRISDATIAQGCIAVEQESWLINSKEKQTIPLFEVQNPGVEQCMVTYRARMKTEALTGRAFLEMWCRFPGQGEFFSKGLHQAAKGATGWASYEITFYLKKGQKPDLIRLNLAVEGVGKIWIKDIELLQTPLHS